LAQFDDVVILQEVLLDRLPVHQSSVGTAQILQERVVQDRHDHGMLAADRKIVDDNIVVWLATECGALLAERIFTDHHAIEAQDQLRHRSILVSHLNQAFSRLSRPRSAAKDFFTLIKITEMLSRPPLSLAICTS